MKGYKIYMDSIRITQDEDVWEARDDNVELDVNNFVREKYFSIHLNSKNEVFSIKTLAKAYRSGILEDYNTEFIFEDENGEEISLSDVIGIIFD